MGNNKVEISADVHASSDKVWEAWTEPRHITQWNFADPSWHCPHAENDLRPGGKYMARMEAKDGSFGFDFEAVYDEVTPKSRIQYTMGDGRVALTTFEDNGGSTKVTTWFDPENQNEVEFQKAGWQAIMNSFKGYVEG